MPTVVLEKTSPLQRLEFHRSDVTSCDFDCNFRLISGSSDKTVSVWTWKTGCGYVQTFYSPISEYKYGVSCVLSLPNEAVFVTGSFDGGVLLWDTESGTLLHTFMHKNLVGVRSICFLSGYNYLVSAADDGSICIWSIDKKVLIRAAQAHDETVTTVCSSFDGNLILTGDSNGVLKLWHTSVLCEFEADGVPFPVHTLNDCHDLGVNYGNFSRDISTTDDGKKYKFATCGNDNTFKVWSLTLKKRKDDSFRCYVSLLQTCIGHASAVTSVKFSPSGQFIVTTSIDKTTRLWKASDDYRCIKVLEGHTRYVTTCSFSPDGTLLATGSNDKLLIVWDLTGELSMDSQLLTDTLPMCVDTVTNSPHRNKKVLKISQKIDNLGNAINSCCFSKNDLLVAGGTDKLLRLWHRTSSTDNKFVELSLSPMQAHTYSINQVEFSACGNFLASCSLDGTTIIWDMTTYKQRGTLFGREGGIKACRFSPDSKFIAAGGDHELVTLWNVDNQSFIQNMAGHTDAITCLSFTCDSKYLASGCGGGHFRLWCVVPCITICLLFAENVHDLGLVSTDFSKIELNSKKKNKYLLATCGNDSLVKVWNIIILDEISAKHKLINQFQGHGGDVTCVRFPCNSVDILASTATDKTARIWDVNAGTCLHILDSKDMMLTCCSFSADASLLATAGLDRSIIIWDLRSSEDEFEKFALNRLTAATMEKNDKADCDQNLLEDDATLKTLEKQLNISMSDIPDEFVCPITQQIMMDPVSCADGYSYERRAIESWFRSGKFTSPMTNESLSSITLVPNIILKDDIQCFIGSHLPEDHDDN